MSQLTKPLIDLLNRVENPNHRIMAFAVPLRIVRITATDDTFKTFRVEQLVITGKDPHNPRGTWTTLSTHGSEVTGAAYNDAGTALIEAQNNLRKKLQRTTQNLRAAQNIRGRLMVPA